MLAIKQKNPYLFLRTAVIFTLFLMFTLPCFAEEYYSTETTAEERAVFAFFKAANMAPDYDLL